MSDFWFDSGDCAYTTGEETPVDFVYLTDADLEMMEFATSVLVDDLDFSQFFIDDEEADDE